MNLGERWETSWSRQEELEAWRIQGWLSPGYIVMCMEILERVKTDTKDKGSKHATHEMLRNMKAGIELRLPLCWLSFLILESARLVAGWEGINSLNQLWNLWTSTPRRQDEPTVVILAWLSGSDQMLSRFEAHFMGTNSYPIKILWLRMA